jgi:type IV fimbrial biogenesis protein FimT
MNHFSTRSFRRQGGVSLIESLMAVAVAAISVGAALPGFDELRQRRHFEGAAAQLETDILLARSDAVAQNRTVRLSFKSGVTGSCYVIHTGAANACSCAVSGPATCTGGEIALRSVGFRSGGALSLVSNSPSMAFDPIKGTTTPTGTIRLQAASGQAVHVVVNVMGRVRTCSPGPAVQGYKAC